jgi:purine-cytosine permease-like protein
MGYWVTQWCVMQVEDELIFRRGMSGYNWDDGNDPARLPLGIAAFVSFLFGWTGAVLSMYQVWFVGPIAQKALGDLGTPISAGIVAILYPPLRWLEIRWFKR